MNIIHCMTNFIAAIAAIQLRFRALASLLFVFLLFYHSMLAWIHVVVLVRRLIVAFPATGHPH